jgi:uncharacterized protein (DUF488 family)
MLFQSSSTRLRLATVSAIRTLARSEQLVRGQVAILDGMHSREDLYWQTYLGCVYYPGDLNCSGFSDHGWPGMLNRQRVLVHLLQRAGRPVSKIHLMKWCFLLRNEMPSQGGSAFYHFLPYHFGPFSFCLYREIDQLVCEGVVEASGSHSWRVGGRSASPEDVSDAVKQDIVGILRRFNEKSTSQLMNYVYERYPWFTVNSKRKQQTTRPVASLAVYTAGYEGQQIDAFLNMLMLNGIQRLVDVRNNPVSRRYGFHKTTLGRLCHSLDIEYVHRPELGIPAVFRQSLKTQADYEALFTKYEAEVLADQVAAVDAVSQFVKGKPSVLVCMESEPHRCHRTRLANAVSNRSRLPVRHLEPSECARPSWTRRS